MTVSVDHALEPAVLLGVLYGRVHRGEEEIGTHDCSQLAVHIDRHGAHDPYVSRKSIDLHIREDQRSFFHGLHIPRARSAVINYRLPGLCELGSRAVIHYQKSAFRKCDETGICLR